MKAITILQPWAQLIMIRAKRYETRCWQTHHRGPIIIHAGRKFMEDTQRLSTLDPFFTALNNAGFQPPKSLPLGAILGVADIVDCQETDKLVYEGLITEEERQYGDFRPGRWAWRMENTVLLPTPIPLNGQRGLFDIPESTLPNEVKAILDQRRLPLAA